MKKLKSKLLLSVRDNLKQNNRNFESKNNNNRRKLSVAF